METDIEISLISQLNSQVLFDDFYDTVIRTTVLNKKIRCPNAVILTGLSLTIESWSDIHMPMPGTW